MNVGRVYPKRVGPTTLTTSAVSYYTADKRSFIERFSVTNWNSADSSITIYIVPSGESVADGYKIVGGMVVAANDQTSILFPVALEENDQVYALAGDASAVNLTFNVNLTEMSVQ
jgi:hypothetical protein